MANNHYSLGNIIDHVAATDILSGDIVEMGSLMGVAQADIPTGETGAVAIAGVYVLPKTTGGAWTQGEPVVTAGGEVLPGAGLSIAAADADSAATEGLVLLNGNSG